MPIISSRVVRRSSGLGKNIYEAEFSGEPPTKKEVTNTQIQLSFHPAGYGGPNDITIKNNKVTWWSFSSCD